MIRIDLQPFGKDTAGDVKMVISNNISTYQGRNKHTEYILARFHPSLFGAVQKWHPESKPKIGSSVGSAPILGSTPWGTTQGVQLNVGRQGSLGREFSPHPASWHSSIKEEAQVFLAGLLQLGRAT